MKTLKSYPLPGETKFLIMLPPREKASRLANEHYDVTDLAPANDNSGAYWSVKSRSGYVAMIGYVGFSQGYGLAILHKKDDGTRELEVVPDTY